jgi:hypothetical protein
LQRAKQPAHQLNKLKKRTTGNYTKNELDSLISNNNPARLASDCNFRLNCHLALLQYHQIGHPHLDCLVTSALVSWLACRSQHQLDPLAYSLLCPFLVKPCPIMQKRTCRINDFSRIFDPFLLKTSFISRFPNCPTNSSHSQHIYMFTARKCRLNPHPILIIGYRPSFFV